MALQIEIPDEKIAAAFTKAIDELFDKGNYNNPVTSVLDNLIGYGGTMRGELGEQVTNFLKTCMETPEFQTQLGQSIANEMAKRAVDGLEKKK